MKKAIFFIIYITSTLLGVSQSPTFQWAKSMGGNSYDRSFSITADVSGNVYTTGSFLGTVDFNPGPGIFNLTSTGIDGIFISKLDASGNFVWAKQFEMTPLSQGESYSIKIDPNLPTLGQPKLMEVIVEEH